LREAFSRAVDRLPSTQAEAAKRLNDVQLLRAADR
jgi:hypothetical protein